MTGGAVNSRALCRGEIDPESERVVAELVS